MLMVLLLYHQDIVKFLVARAAGLSKVSDELDLPKDGYNGFTLKPTTVRHLASFFRPSSLTSPKFAASRLSATGPG